MLEIKLKDRYVEYSFTIQDKYTLLRGDTATGKTTLYDLFEAYVVNPMNIYCSGYKYLAAIPNLQGYKEYADILLKRHKQVLIIDESNLLFSIHGFEQLLNDSDNYFIIICRKKSFANLPIHLRSVVHIVSSGRFHTFKPIYTLPEQINKFTACICEDSQTGNKFIAQFLPNVSTCAGKDNIIDTLKEFDEPLLLVYDVAGIGAIYDDILAEVKQHTYPITHLAWDSFESYIIDETLYKQAPRPEYDCNYNSYEDYSTEVLHDVLAIFPGVNYNKSGLPHCLRTDRCRACNKTAFCPYVAYSADSLVTGRLKSIIEAASGSNSDLSPELVEKIWNQMPNAIKPEYGTTKEEIVANYYKQYSHMFQ